MDSFEKLLEKLDAYVKLEDKVNQRKIIDTMIEEYPGEARGWYEKARLLTGDFKENMVLSEGFLKCMNSIEKLIGTDNEYYRACEEFKGKAAPLPEKPAEPDAAYATAEPVAAKNNNSVFLLWGLFAVLSLGAMCLPYYTIKSKFLDDVSYNGYQLITRESTVGIIGKISLGLAVLAIVNIATSVCAYLGKVKDNAKLSKAMLVESIVFVAGTVTVFILMSSTLKNAGTETMVLSVDKGVYLNVVLAVAAIVSYFAVFVPRLKEKKEAT